jgi:hypothetical protein
MLKFLPADLNPTQEAPVGSDENLIAPQPPFVNELRDRIHAGSGTVT